MGWHMTTVALIADVHANALALEAVLRACSDRKVGAIWCAGDIVGYNAMPSETIALVRRRAIATVHGNHDLMVSGKLSADESGPRARRAVEWTKRTLSPDELTWITSLPALLKIGEHVLCVHATLGNSQNRIQTDDDWRAQADRLREFQPATRICICGHTHTAGATYVAPDGRVRTDRASRVSLDGDGIWFINPGSVGEPRDGDPRASFAVLDWPPKHVSFHRVRYDRARLAKLNAVRMPPSADAPRNVLTQWLETAAARLGMQRQ
jgi:diadenosine tetraphosphatase ApaH/serine/threonine PP2A family protein phosphatase